MFGIFRYVVDDAKYLECASVIENVSQAKENFVSRKWKICRLMTQISHFLSIVPCTGNQMCISQLCDGLQNWILLENIVITLVVRQACDVRLSIDRAFRATYN